jgi:hypothetical protein
MTRPAERAAGGLCGRPGKGRSPPHPLTQATQTFRGLLTHVNLTPPCLSPSPRSPDPKNARYDHAKFEYYAPINALFGVQVLLFAWAELRRLQDIRNPGSVNQDPIFSQYRCVCACV